MPCGPESRLTTRCLGRQRSWVWLDDFRVMWAYRPAPTNSHASAGPRKGMTTGQAHGARRMAYGAPRARAHGAQRRAHPSAIDVAGGREGKTKLHWEEGKLAASQSVSGGRSPAKL
jgi:hypothetical protein